MNHGLKFVPNHSLIVANGEIFPLTQNQLQVLSLLLRRPIWEEEVKKLPSVFVKKYLEKKKVKFTKNNLSLFLKASYEKCEKEEARSVLIEVIDHASFFWGEESKKTGKGFYFFENGIPTKIEGSIKKKYFKKLDVTTIRDEWILKKLKSQKLSSILELGCGRSERLKEKVLNHYPNVNYMGVDVKISNNSTNLKLDITKEIPAFDKEHTVVLEEVIEHLPEEKILPLIKRIRKNYGNKIIMTTPNRTYNKYLGVEKRHHDHQFEWNKVEITRWGKRVETLLDCSVSINEIGKKIQGVAPSWGIIISFL
jgi:hypothetical protein